MPVEERMVEEESGGIREQRRWRGAGLRQRSRAEQRTDRGRSFSRRDRAVSQRAQEVGDAIDELVPQLPELGWGQLQRAHALRRRWGDEARRHSDNLRANGSSIRASSNTADS